MTLFIKPIIIILIIITTDIIIMRVRVTIFSTFIVFSFILVHIFRKLKPSTGAPVDTERLSLHCTAECAPLCSITW